MTATSSKHYAPSMIRSSEASTSSSRCCSASVPSSWTPSRAEGFTTREYVIFGTQWWLYVLNRIAEEPERVYTALIDAALISTAN